MADELAKQESERMFANGQHEQEIMHLHKVMEAQLNKHREEIEELNKIRQKSVQGLASKEQL